MSSSSSSHHPADDIVHIKGFVGDHAYLSALTERLLKVKSEALVHNFKGDKGLPWPVKSRPKQVFGLRNDSGEFGLYYWGQVKEDFTLINDMPEFASELLDFTVEKLVSLSNSEKPQLQEAIPFFRKMNHMLLTFGENGTKAIPPHNDKAYSSYTDGGRFEQGTPILLFNFGATRKFLISSNDAKLSHNTEVAMRRDGVFLKAFNFEGGDLIVLPGRTNVLCKHSIEIDPDVTAPRISIVLRLVDASFVNPEQGYYIHDGQRGRCQPEWPKQPPLPKELQGRLRSLDDEHDDEEDEQLAKTGLLTTAEERDAMFYCDPRNRVVGRMQTTGGCVVTSTFITPYWESAGRRALVDGLLAMHSLAASAVVLDEPMTPAAEEVLDDSSAPAALLDATSIPVPEDDFHAFDNPVPDDEFDSEPEAADGADTMTFEGLCNMDYYEALGVDRKAKEKAITAAYRKLAKRHHPDKGGDPKYFMVYKYMYEILNDYDSRSKYDEEGGRTHFAAGMPNNPHVPAAPSALKHEVFEEHINVNMAKRFLDLVAMRQLKINGSSTFSFADILQSFINRSKKGVITAHWCENGKAREMGLLGRRNAGFGSSDLFLDTIGCFPLPKLIRYILRSGFGDRMVDLDQTDAYWHCLLEILDDWKVQDQFPLIKARVEQKQVFYDALPGSDDEKKKVFLTILFQGSLPLDMPEIVHKLNQEVVRFMREVKSRRKDLCKIAAGWGKTRPEVTVASYLLMDKERRHLDEMTTAAGNFVMSPEADGLVVFDASPEVIANIYKACTVPLKAKPYPQTFEAIIEFAKSKYPGMSWDLRSKYPWSSIQVARECIQHDLDPLRQKDDPPMSGHTDFAKVVHAGCEGRLLLDDKSLYQCFDNGLWTVHKKGGLHGIVRDYLHSAFGFRQTSVVNGKLRMQTRGEPVKLKDHSFLSHVRDEVDKYVLGDAPKLDESTRGLLAFSGGTVYDFEKGKARMVHQQDLLRRHVPWPYKEIDPKLQKTWDLLIKDIIVHWEAKRGDLQEDPDAPAEDPAVKTAREALKRRMFEVCKQSEFLKVLLGICKDEVDELLYLLQHLCRMMSSYPRLCELLYIHGPAKAGKDVLASMIQTFFGDVSDGGFCASLPNDYFEQKPGAYGRRGSEDSHPMIHSIRGARVVLIPEAPCGQTNMSVLKPLCEQEGTKIASRTHCKDPERSHPTYEFVFFSNNNMEIGPSPDGGEARRVNVFRLCNIFGSKDGQYAEQADLKGLVKKGRFVHEMFHLTKALYPALGLYTTNIRRPARIERETWEVTQSSLSDADTKAYILEKCMASDASNCSTADSVKTLLADYLHCTKKQVANKMVELGFEFSRTERVRYCMYEFVDGQGKKPVLIKTFHNQQ
jgi:hypothetical protein